MMGCVRNTKNDDEEDGMYEQAVRMRSQLPDIREPAASRFFMWPADRPGQVHRVTHNGKSYSIKVLATRPVIFKIRKFLSKQECQHLIQLAEGRLSEAKIMLVDRSATASAEFYRRTRNNTFTWIQQSYDSVVRSVAERSAALLRLPTEAVHSSEALQVLHYGVAEHYYLHTDSSERYARFATVLFYLNDVKKGGDTAFPLAECGKKKSGLRIQPKRGSAIIFYNYLPNGQLDSHALHAATDIMQGEKWAANQWISLSALRATLPEGDREYQAHSMIDAASSHGTTTPAPITMGNPAPGPVPNAPPQPREACMLGAPSTGRGSSKTTFGGNPGEGPARGGEPPPSSSRPPQGPPVSGMPVTTGKGRGAPGGASSSEVYPHHPQPHIPNNNPPEWDWGTQVEQISATHHPHSAVPN